MRHCAASSQATQRCAHLAGAARAVAANNWPLKGGKLSNWEGGTRVNAFVSGGFLPAARRGTVEPGFTAIEDWCVRQWQGR